MFVLRLREARTQPPLAATAAVNSVAYVSMLDGTFSSCENVVPFIFRTKNYQNSRLAAGLFKGEIVFYFLKSISRPKFSQTSEFFGVSVLENFRAEIFQSTPEKICHMLFY